MFNELKSKYEKSMKEKEDYRDYAKRVHAGLMNISDIGLLLKDTCVEEFVLNAGGGYIRLKSGLKLHVNENDYEEVPITCLCKGDYEIEETKMVYKILELCKNIEDFTVFDIGANIGWYSLNILNKYPRMKVYSFEPGPVTFKRLKNNFELNEFNTEGLVNMGLYDKNEKLDFYYDTEGSGASSLVDLRGRDSVRKISIDVRRLDEWFEKKNIAKVDFIKCDVEGSEFFVYQGGEKVIAEYKPIVFSEMLRKWAAKFNYHPNDIITFFDKLGYRCYVINNCKLVQIEEVLETTVETNYFFLHRQKHEDIIRALS